MKKFRSGLCALFLVIASSQASDARPASVIGEFSDITISENGQGPAADGCAKFRVTPDDVATFLRHAILITGRQDHDWFLHGSCYARGKLSSRYGDWEWEIRDLGTATITSITGETFVLADPRRESSLEEDGPAPYPCCDGRDP